MTGGCRWRRFGELRGVDGLIVALRSGLHGSRARCGRQLGLRDFGLGVSRENELAITEFDLFDGDSHLLVQQALWNLDQSHGMAILLLPS